MSKFSMMTVIGAASMALLLSACGQDTTDDGATPSTTSTSSASTAGTSADEAADITGSSVSIDGNRLEGSFLPFCQHQDGSTFVVLFDFANENNTATGSFTDDGSIVTVGIGKTANDDFLWEAFPLIGKGSVNMTRDGDLSFTFTGEAVNKENQATAPFTLSVVCDRIDEQ